MIVRSCPKVVGFLIAVLTFLGVVVWQTSGARAAPPGPYFLTCTGVKISSNGTLFALCPDYFGTPLPSIVPNYKSCQTLLGLWNVNGTIECIISVGQSFGGQDTFDLVSKTDTTNAKGETIVWRIEQPNPKVPSEDFRSISFKPGDQLMVTAGGCVQTGGSGQTWKSYTFPDGTDAGHLYSGQIEISNVTQGGLQNIGGIIGLPLIVRASAYKNGSSPFLSLGYTDDNWSDNGYGAHDNGNPVQCVGVGPAWVQVTVTRPAAQAPQKGVSWYPWSRPFDLTFDQNALDDGNGLPVNPIWAYQINNKDSLPDFAKICGPAFSGGIDPILFPIILPAGGTNVNEAILRQYCTTNQPSTDLYVNPLPGLCKGVLDGHLNWSYATYTGGILWREYDDKPFEDGDYNMGLVTKDNAALTAQSSAGDNAFGLEFNAQETIDHFDSDFWTGPPGSAFTAFTDNVKHFAIDGKPAVVTGLVGIDGVHGGWSELHPVMAFAVLVNSTFGEGTEDDTWAFFMRNSGTEGGCGRQLHTWYNQSDLYSLQLPWPKNATSVSVEGTPNIHTNSLLFVGPFFQEQDPNTFILLSMPNPTTTDTEGMETDGVVTFRYTVPGAHKHAPPAHSTTTSASKEMDEDDWSQFVTRLPSQSMRDAATAEWRAVPLPSIAGRSIQLHVSTVITPYHRTNDEARQGVLVKDHVRESKVREAQIKALAALAAQYAPYLKSP